MTELFNAWRLITAILSMPLVVVTTVAGLIKAGRIKRYAGDGRLTRRYADRAASSNWPSRC